MVTTYAYWISTALLSLLYLASVYMYVTKRDYVMQAQAQLGYSAAHLVPFMIVVKILGPAAILSRFSVPLSDLAYAGSSITSSCPAWRTSVCAIPRPL